MNSALQHVDFRYEILFFFGSTAISSNNFILLVPLDIKIRCFVGSFDPILCIFTKTQGADGKFNVLTFCSTKWHGKQDLVWPQKYCQKISDS